MKNSELDPIMVQILWNRLTSMAEEQAKTLIHASFSAIVAEMEDLACAIYDAEGNLIAQGVTGTQGILTGMSVGVKHMLKKYPIQSLAPGDVLICNDPWLFTGHKYDIAVMTPVFYQGSPVAVTATVLHGSDVGGISSAADSRSVFEEGLEIPILKFFEAGNPNEDLFEMIRGNSRIPDVVIGDLMAQVAANAVTAQQLAEFMGEYSLPSLAPLSRAIISTTEKTVKRSIADLPNGAYSHTAFLDGIDEPLQVVATVIINGEELMVDFAGSSPQTKRGGINSVYNFTFAYAAHALKCVLAPELPNNDGLFRSFKLVAPEASVVNAKFPAPVMARYIMVASISGAVFGALSQAIPDRSVADSSRPTMPLFTGIDNKGEPFIQWLADYGGSGARATSDGYHATCFPANLANAPVEIIENISPLLYVRRELLTDSGGPGKYRGGCSQLTSIKIRADQPSIFHCFWEGTIYPPTGFHGGLDGQRSILEINGQKLPSPKQRYTLQPDEMLSYTFGGGGGYYPPEEREPEAVLRDVINGFVSIQSAAEHYKVWIDEQNKSIDWEKTKKLRDSARNIQTG